MAVITVVSAKHAPGATTTTLVLASAADPRCLPLVLECDPDGGDLAARTGSLFEPGMASLVEEARTPSTPSIIDAHTRSLPTGVRIVVGSVAPERVNGYVGDAAPLLAPLLRDRDNVAFVDAGRWGPAPTEAWAAVSDVVVVVMRPTIESTEHVAARLGAVERVAPHVRPLVIGDGPLRPDDVADILERPVAALPYEPVTARAVGEGRIGLNALRATALYGAAETVLDELLDLIGGHGPALHPTRRPRRSGTSDRLPVSRRLTA